MLTHSLWFHGWLPEPLRVTQDNLISGSDYGPGLETAPSFPECTEHCSIRSSLNPAHETYDDDLGKVIDTKYYKHYEKGPKKVSFGEVQVSVLSV